MREFKLPRHPYDTVQVYKKSTVTINPGVTVLVGCNGSGKSTLLYHIEDELNKSGVPCLSYDNLNDGRDKRQHCLNSGQIEKLVLLSCSSEGEQIIYNMKDYARDAIEFVKNGGKRKLQGLAKVFAEMSEAQDSKKAEKEELPAEYWFLLDAIGSGLSIDNVIALKEKFDQLCKVFPKHLTPYVIIAANDYEFCVGEQCFSVQDGEYVDISSYEDFKKLVFKTRKYKDNQYKKWAEKDT